MKKTMQLLGITIISAGLLMAQGPGMGRGMRSQQQQPATCGESRVERMALFLDLTESQKAAALTIFQAVCDGSGQQQNEAAELRERWQAAIRNGDAGQIDSLSQEWANMMSAHRATGAKAQIEFRRLLTAEQLEKLDALKGTGLGMMGNRGRGMGAMNLAGCLRQQP